MNKGGNTCIQLNNWDKSARQWCWKVEDSNFRENEKLGKRFCGQHQCAEQQRLLVPIISQFLPPFQHLSPFQIHTTTFQLANISKVYKNIQQFKKNEFMWLFCRKPEEEKIYPHFLLFKIASIMAETNFRLGPISKTNQFPS